jgi:hypothetical protein
MHNSLTGKVERDIFIMHKLSYFLYTDHKENNEYNPSIIVCVFVAMGTCLLSHFIVTLLLLSTDGGGGHILT